MRNAEESAPSDKQIEKLVQQIKAVSHAVDQYLIHLSPSGRVRRLKPRRGGEKVSKLVVRVASQRKLVVAGVSPAEIDGHRTRAARLRPLHAAAFSLARSLDDTILMAETKAWWGTTALYTALKGIARSDGQLKATLEPATNFFALGRRKPKPAATK